MKAYWNVEQRTGSSGSVSISVDSVDVIVTLYCSHVIQTLDVFVVKSVKCFFFLLLLDFSLVNKRFSL